MNYLAVDTSGKNLTLILSYEGKIKEYFDNDCGTNHSVSIMVKIEELKEQLQADFSKLDFIAVVVGAGSFTGIRIGISTVKALCFAFNLPALSITSFDTLAYNKKKGKYLSVIDAKHGSYYVCGYDDKKVVKEPSFIDKEKLLSLKNEFEFLSGEVIDGVDCEIVSVKDGLKNAVLEKANEKEKNLDLISPLYIRKSQAEEGR